MQLAGMFPMHAAMPYPGSKVLSLAEARGAAASMLCPANLCAPNLHEGSQAVSKLQQELDWAPSLAGQTHMFKHTVCSLPAQLGRPEHLQSRCPEQIKAKVDVPAH